AIATVLGLAFAIYKATHDRQMAALLGKIGMVRKQGGESDTGGKSCVCRQRNAIHSLIDSTVLTSGIRNWLRLVPPPVLTSFEPCRKIQETEQEIAQLKRKGHEELRILIEQLQHDLEKAKHDYEELQANHASAETAWRSEVATLREQAARQRETIDSLTQTLEEVREELAARDRAERSRERLSKAAKKLEGRLWQRKVLQDAPRFRS